MKRIRLNDPGEVVAIDRQLQDAHDLFNREYQRQSQLFRLEVGRFPYYSHEKATVFHATRCAVVRASELLIGRRY